MAAATANGTTETQANATTSPTTVASSMNMRKIT